MTRKYHSVKTIAEGQIGDFFGKGILFLKEAACCDAGIDPDSFFPMNKHITSTNRMARKVCHKCPVKVECLEYALDNDERHGIWGGLFTRERDALKRSRSLNGKNSSAPVGNGSPAPDWRRTQTTSESA